MSSVVIRAEELGKKYVIGHETSERYTALRDVLAQQGRRLLRSARDMAAGRALIAGDEREEIWVLKDLYFEISRGDVVGIIGRNGAGKSTLLKILSRITEPSAGRVTIDGRVASLLEVGTGFHPELTGRENIYLNGAILGMRRNEIKRKFDEIVAFAEVEKFLDTPVKRYSSGMYVRLAFAVAAHLEAEILIVDEVLAVGDLEFQKKCLGKMEDVAGTGRTVLFVSHNMAAVSSLTKSGIVLDRGRISFAGPTAEAVKTYAQLTNRLHLRDSGSAWGKGCHTRIHRVQLCDANGSETTQYSPGNPLHIVLTVETDGVRGLSCEIMIADHNKSKVALGSLAQFEGAVLPAEPGIYKIAFNFSPIHLAAGTYSIDATTSIVNHKWDHYVTDALEFEILFSNPGGQSFNFSQSHGYGAVALSIIAPTSIVPVKIDETVGVRSQQVHCE